MVSRPRPYESPRSPVNIRLWGWRTWRRIVRRYRRSLRGLDSVCCNRVQLLANGGDAYAEMLRAIAGATRSIHLEMYTFASDKTGWIFAEALMERARKGVRVRIIYDDVGCLFTSSSMWKALEAAGAEIHVFHPLAPWRRGWHWNRRDHRKILVVDGRVGFAGGMNISDEYAPVEQGGQGWRDTQLMIEGPAVADLQLIFLRSWIKVGGLPPRERFIFDPTGYGNGVAVRVLANRTFRARRSIRHSLLRAFRRARHTIHITHAYFIPDPTLERALEQAVERGVDVKLIVPDRGDVAIALAAGRAAQPRLLKRGIRIFRRLGPVLHAKTVVIDGQWVSMGSCNLNYRSFLHNQEVNVEIENLDFAKQMEALFSRDLEQSAEVRRRELLQRPLINRILDSLAYSIRFWL